MQGGHRAGLGAGGRPDQAAARCQGRGAQGPARSRPAAEGPGSGTPAGRVGICTILLHLGYQDWFPLMHQPISRVTRPSAQPLSSRGTWKLHACWQGGASLLQHEAACQQGDKYDRRRITQQQQHWAIALAGIPPCQQLQLLRGSCMQGWPDWAQRGAAEGAHRSSQAQGCAGGR